MKLSPAFEARRNDDGGFGPVVGAPSEPEATALLAMATDDARARAWLASHQGADGSSGIRAGSVFRDVTALAALALPAGADRTRALDHLLALSGRNGPDPTVSAAGWPWTDGAHGWVEPTAWSLLALRRNRPDATDRIDDALALLRERECVDGGWNYGSRTTLDVDLDPFVQTTGVAVLALGDAAPDLTERGIAVLERRWRSEAAGLLSLATAACALDHGTSGEAAPALDALRNATAAEIEDNVSAAWVLFATEGTGPWRT